MRTRNQSKRHPQSTGENDSKKPLHESESQSCLESINDSGTLTNISRDAVGKLLKRVNKRSSPGFKKQDSSYLHQCGSISKLESGSKGNDKEVIGTSDTSKTLEAKGFSRDVIQNASSELKFDEDDEMNGSDWEDGSIPTLNTTKDNRDNVDNGVTIEFDASPSDSAKRKPVRRASAEEKELAELVHKIHLLCLLGRGRLIDSACNDPLIQASLLSLLPAYLLKISEVAKLTANALAPLVNWFHNNFHIRSPSGTERTFHSALAFAIETREGTPEEVAALSVALFRALNLTTRFVSILNVASLKPDAEKPEPVNQERSRIGKGIFNSSTLMVAKSTEPDISPAKQSALDDKNKVSESPLKGSSETKDSKATTSAAHQVFDKMSDLVPCDLKNDISSQISEGSKRKGDIEFEMELQMALSATSAGVCKTDIGSDVKESDSNSSKISASPFKRLKKIGSEECSSLSQGISTALGSKKVGPPLYWAEVYCSGENLTGKWVHVDAVNAIVDGEQKVEVAAAACKTPLRYAVAFAGNGAKDVTRRYCMKWHKIAPQRVNSIWWDEVLAPLKELESKSTGGGVHLKVEEASKVSDIEDMELQTRALTEPLPTNQQAYKNHQLYAIERWLTKYQILHPKGPVLGLCSGHPVYPRTCVQTLHTKERWLREGLQLKLDELPVKVLKRSVKAQVSESDDYGEKVCGATVALYGKWQTEQLSLPRAVDGIVPKNERGQVDVWSEKCLPPGTVHLRFPRIFTIAKRLEIDYAPAMVGFEFKNGRSIPVYDGIVVCSEFKDAILEAYGEEEERRGAEERKRNEAQAISRWYQLLSSIVTRQRLTNRYGDSLSSNDMHKPDMHKTDTRKPNEDASARAGCSENELNKTQTRRPEQEKRSSAKRETVLPALSINEEEHEHVYLKDDQSFNEESCIRTKRCLCGFSIQVEEL